MKNERTFLVCLLTLFVCRAALATLVVPLWQGPDEPTHFSAVQLLALPSGTTQTALLLNAPDNSLTDTAQQNLQRQILESMARHRWWETRGVPTPAPLPVSFYEVERGRVLPVGAYSQPLYYGLGAVLLRVTGSTDVDGAYRRLRVLAILLSAVALAIGWAGTRLLFGPAIAAGSTAIGVLHPQFLLSAIAVNPDALANVCGAAIWWQAACAIRGRRRHLALVLLVLAAGAAILTKRSAMPVAVIALAIAAWLFVGHAGRTTRRTKVLAGAVIAVVVVLFAGLFMFEDQWMRLVTIWRSAFVVRRPPDRATLSAAVEYIETSIDFAWLVAGWLRFRAPEPWLWVVRVLTLVAAIGAVALTVRSPALRGRLWIAWLFVVPQVIAVVGTGFWRLAAPEGRHLFVVLAPAMVLLWIGLTAAVPRGLDRYSALLVLAGLALLDVTGLTGVLVSAYLPSVVLAR